MAVVVEKMVMVAGAGLGLDAESDGQSAPDREVTVCVEQPQVLLQRECGSSEAWGCGCGWHAGKASLFFADQRRLQCTFGLTQLSSG